MFNLKEKVIYIDNWKKRQIENEITEQEQILTKLGVDVDSESLFIELRQDKRKEYQDGYC